MTPATDWLITVSPDAVTSELLDRLAGLGFEVTMVLRELDLVAGRCDIELLPQLRAIDGVIDVAPDTPMDC
jgi:hypothetical protein